MTPRDSRGTVSDTPTAKRIHQRLLERLQPRWLDVLDETALHAGHEGTGGRSEGTHMRVRIDSPLFEGKVRIAKHRLVYDALQDFIDAGLHALAVEVVQAPPSHVSP